jgi:hypothetical protein
MVFSHDGVAYPRGGLQTEVILSPEKNIPASICPTSTALILSRHDSMPKVRDLFHKTIEGQWYALRDIPQLRTMARL